MPKISVIINKWCGNVLKYLTLKLLLGVCTHIHKCTQTVITTDGLIIVCQLKRWQDTCLRVTGDSFILSIFLPHLKLCVNLWWRSTGASYYVSNLIINSRCLVLTCQWARSGSGHREKKRVTTVMNNPDATELLLVLCSDQWPCLKGQWQKEEGQTLATVGDNVHSHRLLYPITTEEYCLVSLVL